jgi:hypothetical protein
MKNSTENVLKMTLVFGIIPLMLVASGCTTTMPVGGTGVLSSYQQKALNLATQRAIDQAGIDAKFLGNEKLYVDIKGVGSADLGKQHVSGRILSILANKGANIVDDKSTADSVLVCNLNLAGVDTQVGPTLLGRKIDTKADVGLEFKKGQGPQVIQKNGTGTALFHQEWFLGFGPSESLK